MRTLSPLLIVCTLAACQAEPAALSGAQLTAVPALSGDEPAIDTRLESNEWLSYGHDLFNTRHNPGETRITRDNVAQLQLKWSWETAAVTSTPSYRAGVLYFGDWQGGVVAVDAGSGKERWRSFDPQSLFGMITASPTLERDALFIGGNGSLWYRLDPQNGAIRWTNNVRSQGGSANTLSSLLNVGPLVIAGLASFQNINPIDDVIGAPDFHGSVIALDAVSGKQIWEFQTTTGRGAGVCSSIAVDPVRKRLFFGTGQNYDETDSPYADSLIALDYETGKYAWHAQFNRGDSWSLFNMGAGDLDLLASPVLYTVNGVDMVAAGDKGGSFRAFDRDGHPQWQVQLSPGGHHGGVMGSAAVHDGVIYVCSGDFTTDNGDTADQSGPATSSLLALDAGSGVTRWRTPIEGTCYAAVSHANGVVYLPGGDGSLHAFDDRDGRLLWSAPLGQSSAGGVGIANGMLFVSYGWSWSDLAPPGGVKAFGLP